MHHHPLFPLIFGTIALSLASPLEVRVVAELNQDAFKQAQQRDDTATRAFSSTEIKTSDGQCLFVDELSGDFRANLNPIQVAACNGSTGQLWDVITAGKHNDQAGTMLVVNTLTQACMNFDDRRAAGNTVIMFSCGGRADGGGAVTNSQLFSFGGGAGPLALAPKNANGICFAVTNGKIDQAACAVGDAKQSFTFGGDTAAAPALSSTPGTSVPTEVVASLQSTSSSCISTTMLTVTRDPATSSVAATPTSSIATTSTIATTPTTSPVSGNPTGAIPVSRAGGVLNPTAAAQANPRDDTATRAFTSVSLKSSTGQCLSIDPTAGDFRQNLIPVGVKNCTGEAGEKFDFITKGKHNDQAETTLIASSLMQGCLNFDGRRAVGDTVIMFSCGGRADGESGTTDSQLFSFGGGNSIVLTPKNADGTTCLVPKAGKLDSTACSGGAGQVYSIV